MNEQKKVCPLLSIGDEVDWIPCQQDRCAWYVYQVFGPSLPLEGSCAITRLADIADGVRNI